MGCCESKEPEGYDPTKDDGEKPAVRTESLKDPIKRFEKSVPFYRVHVVKYTNALFDLNQEKFPISEMAKFLDTAAWVDQLGEGQPSYKVLMSLPECGDGMVDLISAVVLGLLWCEGGLKDKAEIVFRLLNPPGQQ